MTKSEQREVQKARSLVHADRHYAASTLATLHRAATRKTQAEIAAVVSELGLSGCMEMRNGALVLTESVHGVML